MTSTEVNYGSDKTGLVWGYLMQPGTRPREINSQEAEAILSSAPSETSGFVWLHFSLSNAATERWVREHVAPPDDFFVSLQEGVGSTRLELVDDALVATLHDVLFEFAFDPGHVSTVGLIVRSRIIVSLRLKPLRSIDRLRAEVRAGTTFESPTSLLAQLLSDQADVLTDIIRHATRRIDAVEDGMLRQRIAASRSEVGAMRRLLVRLQRLLAPEPAALFRLLGRPPEWVAEDDVGRLREAAEELAAAVNDSAALVERARLIQEELSANVNEATNRTLFLLTVVTVLALPFNLIGSLLGMNVGGIPFAAHGRGFTMVVLIASAFTVLAVYVVRRAGWFQDK